MTSPLLLLYTSCCLLGFMSCGTPRPSASTTPVAGDAEETQPTLNEPGRLQSLDDLQTKSGTEEANHPLPGCSREAPLPPNVEESATAEELHALGQEAILKKQGKEAVAILARAEAKQPKNPLIIGDLATALLQCRMFDEAIKSAEKAAELAPSNADIAANLAQTYQIAGRIGDAVSAYQEAIEKNPDDPAIHNNLAVLLVLSDLTQAEKEARIATNLDPGQATYLVNLGYILFRKKRVVDAEIILRRAINLDPNNADAHNQLGLVLVALKREPQGIECFEKALELNPHHRAAKENLAAMKQGFDFTGPWDR